MQNLVDTNDIYNVWPSTDMKKRLLLFFKKYYWMIKL